jgi:hypothetical protein
MRESRATGGMRVSLRAIVVALTLAAGLSAFVWHATRRSPHDIARRVSGLRVPAGARVVEFHDVASGAFWQDLNVRVVLALSPAESRQLAEQARAHNYRDVYVRWGSCDTPTDRAGISLTGECDAEAELDSGGAGLFRYERFSHSGYELAVIDTVNRRLVVRVVIL